jgi:hypothetical protein
MPGGCVIAIPKLTRGVFLGFDVLLEYDELVAAEARHKVFGTQHLAQPIGHGTQQFVARGVSQRIVDLLELIEIDEQQRGQPRGALRDRQQPFHFVAEVDPVRQRRQFVIARQMADPGFRVAPFGDVFQQHDGAADRHRLEGPGHCAAAR